MIDKGMINKYRDNNNNLSVKEKRRSEMPVVCFVVPCFNEEENIKKTFKLLANKLRSLKASRMIDSASSILFVDDGSRDDTWSLIKKAAGASDVVRGIRLKKNYGQQTALYVGMTEAAVMSDAVITMDADGQHDLAAVEGMIKKFKAGSDIVCAVRKNKAGLGLLKRITAGLYYRLLTLKGVRLIKGHADYRLVSAKAIRLLEKRHLKTLFLRADFLSLPLKVSVVEYVCRPRRAGRSKYTLRKMFGLAWAGLAAGGIIKTNWRPLCHSERRKRVKHGFATEESHD